MQTTERQNKFIDDLIGSLYSLKSTNDIGSPSHWTAIEEDAQMAVDNLVDPLSEEHPKAEWIKKHTVEGMEWLLVAIRKIETDPNR